MDKQTEYVKKQMFSCHKKEKNMQNITKASIPCEIILTNNISSSKNFNHWLKSLDSTPLNNPIFVSEGKFLKSFLRWYFHPSSV